MCKASLRVKISAIATALIIFVSFQNCSDVDLMSIEKKKVTCDSSVYNIAREVTTVNGSAVYFVQENNYDISQEYSGTIQWIVNGVIQDESIVHNNRLYLDCSTHPETLEVRARFVTDCGSDIEIVENDYTFPDICDSPEPTPPPAPTGPSGNYCQQYLAGLSESEFQEFQKYYVGPDIIEVPGTSRRIEAVPARKLQKIEMPYFEQHYCINLTNLTLYACPKTLGVDSGSLSVVFPFYMKSVNRKYLKPWEYLAITFKVPQASATNSGRFVMSETMPRSGPVDHALAVTISPCPGDFRPRQDPSLLTDPYRMGQCRTPYTSLGTLKASTKGESTPHCYIPADTQMYMNVSMLNLYQNYLSGPEPSDAVLPEEYFCYGANGEVPLMGCGTGVILSL